MIVSKQDANQVLRLAYDDASQSLRITGSSIPGSMTVDQADGSLLHVTVDASALPTGAATEAKQDDQIAQLADIQTAVENIDTNTQGKATEATLSTFSSKTASGMVTVPFDEQVIAYVGLTADIDTVTYKNVGVTVATVSLSYDGQGRLTGVVRS